MSGATAGEGVAIPDARRRLRVEPMALALPVAAFFVYLLTGPWGSGGDAYIPLADALLHGHLTVDGRSWIELVPAGGDRWYVPFPPAPALFYLPVVALMGSQPWNAEISVSVMPALVGAASVALAYAMLSAWQVAPTPRAWLTVGFAGSTFWWAAGEGGHHLFAQVVGVFFTLAALNLAARRRWPVAAGILLGLAAASRLPMGLALPVLLVLYGWRPSRTHLALLAGLALPAALVAAYNLARFGSMTDFGYARIPSSSGLVTDEPWFREGILSLSYIPRSLNAMLFSTFQPVAEPPYLRPSWSALSIVISAPIYLFALRARGGRLVWLLLATAALILLPDLMHGSWGFAQYGYRFVLDAAPVLLLLLGIVYRERISVAAQVAVVIGLAANAYGFWATTSGFIG